MKAIMIILNTFVMAIFYEVILPEYKLSDGGLIGLAMISNYVTEIKLSYIYILFNIPILIWVWKVDKKLFNSSIFGMLSFSLFTFGLNLYELESAVIHPLIAVVISGVVLGFNFFMLGKIKASFGGISPIAIKLEEWGKMKMSKFYLITDVAVLFLLLVTIGAENFVLSLIFVVIQSKAIDFFNKLNYELDSYLKYLVSLNVYSEITITNLLNIDNNSKYLQLKFKTVN